MRPPAVWSVYTRVYFPEALQRNSTLTTLSLDKNPLTNGGTNYYGLQVFARALSTNTTLKTLSLFGCGLSAEVCGCCVGEDRLGILNVFCVFKSRLPRVAGC